jgi:hypothetical protein
MGQGESTAVQPRLVPVQAELRLELVRRDGQVLGLQQRGLHELCFGKGRGKSDVIG